MQILLDLAALNLFKVEKKGEASSSSQKEYVFNELLSGKEQGFLYLLAMKKKYRD